MKALGVTQPSLHHPGRFEAGLTSFLKINSDEVEAAKEGTGTWALESDSQVVAASEQRK